MNQERNRYSSAPMYGMKKKRSAKPSGGGFQLPDKKKNNHRPLQVIMSVVLPLLFILTLLISVNYLRWAFVAAAAVALLAMFGLRAFVKNARYTLTLIYTSLIIVTLVTIWLSTPAADTGKSSAQDAYAGLFSTDSSASMIDLTGLVSTDSTTATDNNTSSANIVSDAQRVFEQFMVAWGQSDNDGMIALSNPTWVAQQSDPQSAIFLQVRRNRLPLSYTIESVSGSDADTSRTITMTAAISANGTDVTTFRFQVLMLRVNETWYVDPNSLTAFETLTNSDMSNATQMAGAVTEVTGAADPSAITAETVLYYNDGGRYYHLDPYCQNPNLNAKYLPLTLNFYYSQVNDTSYKNLLPCSYCNAPAR